MTQQHRVFQSTLTLTPILIIVLLFAAAKAFAQPFTFSRTFDDPNVSDPRDSFGSSVALDGNRVLIGDRANQKTSTHFVGQAHMFDATTGSLLWTFDDPNVSDDDGFGFSVALDGNRVLIGAPGDSTNGASTGQAHLFDATTGNLLWTFDDPTVTGIDDFGRSVALDGNRVLIGARGDDTKGENVGQAHLFDAISGNLLQTFDDPTVTSTDGFGGSVALDGNLVLIGADGDNTNGESVGQAHLFDAISGNLLQTFDDPTVTSSDRFGSFVALDGNRVLIGARFHVTNGASTPTGQAHLFDATTGNLLQTFDDPTVTGWDQFGRSVALDGNHVLIGAPFDDTNGRNAGQAYLFDAATGNLLWTFDESTVTGNDKFGTAVALDGNLVLIGAPNEFGVIAQAHLFAPSCDFDSDLACGIDDLNAMLVECPIAPGVTVTPGVNDQFDLTGDGVFDLADLDAWLAQAGTVNGFSSPYKRADANLDGTVDGQDFVLWNAGKFTPTLLWDGGDFNGDGEADGQDFVIWNGNKFTSSDLTAVPEPGTSVLLFSAMISYQSDPLEETKSLSATKARQVMGMPDSESLTDYRDRAILKFYVYSGARISTGCRLKVSDFHDDDENPTIRLKLKGGKTQTIGIHYAAAEAIRDYLAAAEITKGHIFRPRVHLMKGYSQ